MKSKYIVFHNPQRDIEAIIIFEGFITHADIQVSWNNAVSAGFVDTKGECWGESTTMNLKSRGEEDSKLARRLLEGQLA